jgi:hypothetical protein
VISYWLLICQLINQVNKALKNASFVPLGDLMPHPKPNVQHIFIRPQSYLHIPSVKGSSTYQSINPCSMVDIKTQVCLSYHYDKFKNICKDVNLVFFNFLNN